VDIPMCLSVHKKNFSVLSKLHRRCNSWSLDPGVNANNTKYAPCLRCGVCIVGSIPARAFIRFLRKTEQFCCELWTYVIRIVFVLKKRNKG
jgi:hypothetical protein